MEEFLGSSPRGETAITTFKTVAEDVKSVGSACDQREALE